MVQIWAVSCWRSIMPCSSLCSAVGWQHMIEFLRSLTLYFICKCLYFRLPLKCFSLLCWLQDALMFYARLQLNLLTGAADGCLLVDQLLDVVSKDLDLGSMSSSIMPWWVFLLFKRFINFVMNLVAINGDLNHLYPGVMVIKMIDLELWVARTVDWWNLQLFCFIG